MQTFNEVHTTLQTRQQLELDYLTSLEPWYDRIYTICRNTNPDVDNIKLEHTSLGIIIKIELRADESFETYDATYQALHYALLEAGFEEGKLENLNWWPGRYIQWLSRLASDPIYQFILELHLPITGTDHCKVTPVEASMGYRKYDIKCL